METSPGATPIFCEFDLMHLITILSGGTKSAMGKIMNHIRGVMNEQFYVFGRNETA